jgi:signal peptidase I
MSYAPTPLPEAVPIKPKFLRTIAGWARDLAVSLIVSALIIVFLYQPVKVEGTSMLPGLTDQERIFINKFVYHLEPISRGDIVVFRYPRDTAKSYIKRVIAVPGDRVRIDDGRVYVNGRRIRETYVPDDYRDDRSYAETVVPADSYFLLGDHRSSSSDSRDFGPVERGYIYGKAVFVYWPMEKLGVLK